MWNPDLMLVKQVVEHEHLPITLLKLLDDNFTITDTNQDLLRAVVRCVCVFSKNHSNCLEGMLRLGFRPKIVSLIQQPLIELPLLRSGLAALAVLCGHSHSTTASLPAAVALTTKELFDILYSQHVILATLMREEFAQLDRVVLINVFTVLRYMLPLCSPSDKLFQAILDQLLYFLRRSWNLSEEVSRHVLVTLNVCLEEILLVSPLVNREIWMTAGFSEALLSQLIQSGSQTDESLTQLACSCLSVVNTLLMEGSSVEVLTKSSNLEFIRRSASLVSSPDISWYAMTFLAGCMHRRELLPAITASGAMDSLFLSLLQFKTHSSAVSSLLGSGPIFNIMMANGVVKLMSDFLKADVSGRANMFSPNHIDAIGQLHSIICNGMNDGQLGLSDELVGLTKGMVSLIEAIRDGHVAARTASATYITDMVSTLLSSWTDKLNAAFSKHANVATAATMDVDSAGVGHSFFFAQAAPSDAIIDVTLIPSWSVTLSERIQVPATCTLTMLENGLACKYGTNVSLFKDQKTLSGQHIPIATQAELESMFQLFVDNRGTHPVVICVMPAVNNIFTNEQVRLSLQKGALYNAVGLVPKEVTLRELRNDLRAAGVQVKSALMSDFYDYFNSRNVSEVNVSQFVECMTSPNMKFTEASARSIFNAFDADKNNLLSLKELGLGFAKMTDGSVDDKLLLMFQAYDADHNNYLDLNELTHMIHVASGASLTEANQYASAVIRQVDKNADAKLDFMEFRDAAYKQLIPVAILWSEGNLDFIAGGGHHNNNQHYDNHNKRKGPQSGSSSPRRERSNSSSGRGYEGHHNHDRNNDRGNVRNHGRANSGSVPKHGGKAWSSPNSPRRGGYGSPHGGTSAPQHSHGRSQSFSYNNNRPPPLALPKPVKVRTASPSRRGTNPFGR